MPLERQIFHVYTDNPDDPAGEPIEDLVEVRGVDQLRAELEGKRLGVGIKDAMHATYLWAWAAMVREGKLDPKTKFQAFMETCVQVEGKDNETAAVDPTRQAASADSPSP